MPWQFLRSFQLGPRLSFFNLSWALAADFSHLSSSSNCPPLKGVAQGASWGSLASIQVNQKDGPIQEVPAELVEASLQMHLHSTPTTLIPASSLPYRLCSQKQWSCTQTSCTWCLLQSISQETWTQDSGIFLVLLTWVGVFSPMPNGPNYYRLGRMMWIRAPTNLDGHIAWARSKICGFRSMRCDDHYHLIMKPSLIQNQYNNSASKFYRFCFQFRGDPGQTSIYEANVGLSLWVRN